MIRSSCAWARGGLRRIPSTTESIARNNNHGFGNAIHLGRGALRVTKPRIHTRCHTTKPSKAPETAQTIPGPSWLWLDPIYEPFRAYGRVQQRKPYMTQFISSLVIYFVGDLVAQGIAGDAPAASVEQSGLVAAGDEDVDVEEQGWVQQWSSNRDWSRTGRAIVIGGLSSIPSYRWFLWLGNNFNYGSKILSLSTKVIVNQALFTPLFNSYFFGMQSLLSGATLSDCAERIKNTVPTSWINSCKLWPIVTAFSFTYIPIQYRSIFGGVIAIGWQTYLSLLNQRAAAMEEGEHKLEVEMVEKTQRMVGEREEREKGEKCAA